MHKVGSFMVSGLKGTSQSLRIRMISTLYFLCQNRALLNVNSLADSLEDDESDFTDPFRRILRRSLIGLSHTGLQHSKARSREMMPPFVSVVCLMLRHHQMLTNNYVLYVTDKRGINRK
ncbi:hypothetical protein Bpfe_004013 [Biomphalaria pfeifferi]|uniref:Uncharacterized protein n=1 Tax=Biomphalaria pfeifferi TaxID=112525 RepID=A0AAD8C511_BIOPF|nr:hypothetical protein Bpfe_004013 [Biomphalaria pfeifferi]